MAILVPARLAQPPRPLVTISSPGLRPPRWSDDDISDCWAPIMKIDGCVTEMYEFLYKNQFSSVGPQCSQAIGKIDDSCWPRMFPFHPKFQSMIKEHSAKFVWPEVPE
ncbi:unnamed protein product [Ilex paraguariensis]|uniref:Prolamin-like domain-containing protein n=1 Tax=Ilex paraguariensis TaxID=185542 RepID=A0ABC8RU17_9AQUA